MAKLKLVPVQSSISGYSTGSGTTDYSKLVDMSDDTYISFKSTNSAYGGTFHIVFDVLPNDIIIDSVTVKCRVKGTGNVRDYMYLGYALQYTSSPSSLNIEQVSIPSTDEIITISSTDPTKLVNLVGYKPVLTLFTYSTNTFMDVYGAEITIVYHHFINKVEYDGMTLIDLTSDTATASDVKTGVIFHLASGVQTTGTMTTQMSTKSTTTESGYDTTNISIYGLAKEPSWFILICASADDGIENKVLHIIYDGSSITERNAGSTAAGMVSTTPTSGKPNVAYSNGRLDIDHYADFYYFGWGEWELFYM